jgi:hypothetical protein
LSVVNQAFALVIFIFIYLCTSEDLPPPSSDADERCQWEIHIRNIVVSIGGKLTYVLFYATAELHQRIYVVIFEVFILFYCL